MQEREERCVWLTEEEALGLLDVVMVCPGDLTPAQRTALLKISDHCRQYFRARDRRDGQPPLAATRPLAA